MKPCASLLLLFCLLSNALAFGEPAIPVTSSEASPKPFTEATISTAAAQINEDKKAAGKNELEKTPPVQIAGQGRLAFMGISAALLLGFTVMALSLAGKHGIFSFSSFVIGEDNRYSKSKCQAALWFAVVIVTYVAVVLLRYRTAGGEYLVVNIPQNLLLLSGMSVLTFGAAKAITTSKSKPEDTQAAADAVAKALAARADADAAKRIADAKTALAAFTKSDADVKASADAQADYASKADAAKAALDAATALAKIDGYNMGKPSLFRDLLHNDFGKPDFGDFQMLVVTLLAVCVYLVQVYAFMGHVELLKAVALPDVDTTILSAFGLGQGAYLTKKYAGNVGES